MRVSGFVGVGDLRYSGSSYPSDGTSTYGEDQGSIGSEEIDWDLEFLVPKNLDIENQEGINGDLVVLASGGAAGGAESLNINYDNDNMERTIYSRYLNQQNLTQGDLIKIRDKILKGQSVTELIEKIKNSDNSYTQLQHVPTLLSVINVLPEDRVVFIKFMKFFARNTERFTSIIKGKEECKQDLFNKQVENMQGMISQLPSTGRYHPYN